MARTVTIRPVLNGFVCEVGCQTVVFNSLERVCALLGQYYADPDKMEKAFLDNAPTWYKPNMVAPPPLRPEYPDPVQTEAVTPGGSCGRG